MAKYNPMFTLKSGKEMIDSYKNPSVIINFMAIILVVLSFFIPMYMNAGGSVKLEVLLRYDGYHSVVLATTILIAVATLTAFILCILFKNSPKLSALSMILGGIILISMIFQLIWCTKIGGTDGHVMANGSLYIGGFLVILASILIIGVEFYKLGWQGYEIEEKKEKEEQIDDAQSEEFEDIELLMDESEEDD